MRPITRRQLIAATPAIAAISLNPLTVSADDKVDVPRAVRSVKPEHVITEKPREGNELVATTVFEVAGVHSWTFPPRTDGDCDMRNARLTIAGPKDVYFTAEVHNNDLRKKNAEDKTVRADDYWLVRFEIIGDGFHWWSPNPQTTALPQNVHYKSGKLGTSWDPINWKLSNGELEYFKHPVSKIQKVIIHTFCD